VIPYHHRLEIPSDRRRTILIGGAGKASAGRGSLLPIMADLDGGKAKEAVDLEPRSEGEAAGAKEEEWVMAIPQNRRKSWEIC
jgi:hypothetical protein